MPRPEDEEKEAAIAEIMEAKRCSRKKAIKFWERFMNRTKHKIKQVVAEKEKKAERSR
ncbi:MAG: hypothetical protein M3416_00130 [Acidobacteriota bacterium]|nr:hypothetical protein [Acidobacteriota bacterium]